MNPVFSNLQCWEVLPTGAADLPMPPRRPKNGPLTKPSGRRQVVAPVRKQGPPSSPLRGEEAREAGGPEVVATAGLGAAEWELGAAKALAQITSQVSLRLEAKDSFYGSLSGRQVEAEIRSLGQILKGLLHDFSAVKGLIQNIDEQSSKVVQRVESLESGAIAKLQLAGEIADGRILGLVGQAELLDARLSAAEDSPEKYASLCRRVESLDERITACEDANVNAAAAIAAAAAAIPCYPEFDGVPLDGLQPPIRPRSVCTNCTSDVLSNASPRASPEAVASELAQKFVEGVENLGPESLAEVRRLRRELSDTPRVCLLGPDALEGSDTETLLKELAKSLTNKLGRGVSFVCIATQGVQQKFAESLGANAKTYVLRPVGQNKVPSAFEHCTSISAGRDVKQLMDILPRVGDVFFTVEGGPSLSTAARAAAAAGALVVPLTRTGGASAGHYGFPASAFSRQVMLHGQSVSWAQITDSSSSFEENAQAVATAVASLLELRGFGSAVS